MIPLRVKAGLVSLGLVLVFVLWWITSTYVAG